MPSLLISCSQPADATIILLLDHQRSSRAELLTYAQLSQHLFRESRLPPSLLPPFFFLLPSSPSPAVFTIFIATAKSRCVSAGAEIRRANEEPEPTREKNTMTASIMPASEPSPESCCAALTCLISAIERACHRACLSSSKNHHMPLSVFFFYGGSRLSHLRSNYSDSFCVTGTGSCSLFTLLHILPCTRCIH